MKRRKMKIIINLHHHTNSIKDNTFIVTAKYLSYIVSAKWGLKSDTHKQLNKLSKIQCMIKLKPYNY